MKKFLLASAAVAALLSGVAQADENNSFTGWNFGLQGGLVNNKFENKVKVANAKLKTDKTSGTIGVFTGYGYQFENNFYLGAELEANLFNGTASKTVAGVKAQNKAKNDFGANLRAGYVFDNNILGYVLIGANSTEVESKVAAVAKKSKRLNGTKIGAGVEAKFNQYFARLQYDYKTTADKEIIKGVKTDLDQHAVRAGFGMII